MPTDPAISRRGVELHEQLRAFLVLTMGRENAIAIALALTYELVSIVASQSSTKDQAIAALDRVLLMAHGQLDEFGVGHPHP